MEENRSMNATVVLTPAEKEALRHMAFEARKTESTFIRDVLLEHTDLTKRASFFGGDGTDEFHTEIPEAQENGA